MDHEYNNNITSEEVEEIDNRKVKKIKLNNEELKIQKTNELFRSVWDNIVLFRLIFVHVRLYKKNERVIFNNREELIEYPERDYINTLWYSGKTLEIGDLPTGSDELKKVCFKSFNLESPINGNAIPYGVEVLDHYNGIFSTLPPTIHTLIFQNILSINNDNNDYRIPPNITYLSLLYTPNISGNNENGNGYLTIPNTIRELKFFGSNEDIELRPGDIPEGVTSLTMTDSYISKIGKEILPSTIKELILSKDIDEPLTDESNYYKGLFDFLPPNIEILYVVCNYITPESNLFKFTSIKDLSIQFSNRDDIKGGIEPNSLPQSLTRLSLEAYPNKLEKDIIPYGVTHLYLNIADDGVSKNSIPNSVTSLESTHFITEPDSFPESLTHLTFGGSDLSQINLNEQFIKMLKILPNSLTSITIPNNYKEFKNVTFPQTIKKINYDKFT